MSETGEKDAVFFESFCLDKEKDIIVDLYRKGEEMFYVLRTPNHGTGNLITNLARLCDLPLSEDGEGLKVIRGRIPCYVDGNNREVYIFHLGETKVANIYPDGSVERKAAIPAIAKTLMSQTKNYRLDFRKTLVKTYIPRECKFRTDLHTHMNANLDPDILIALGIHHQVRYPLYYIRKLDLRLNPEQQARMARRRKETAERLADSPLKGKYLDRKINDNTFLNFADLILNNLENAAWNIPRIRASLAVMKDGQAVFTNLEKVYLYRYVFTKGIPAEDRIPLRNIGRVPDREIESALFRMELDREDPAYARFNLLQDKLLWVARGARSHGIDYMEISDTTLVKPGGAAAMLSDIHQAMPAIYRETGVRIRFLAALRRIPLTIVRDQIAAQEDLNNQIRTLRAVAPDPYVAGSDIIGEEINDIRDLKPALREIVRIAGETPGFVVRIHAGENDSLRDNVYNSLLCVREALTPGQAMPPIRIGHGLYTADLSSRKGRTLIRELKEDGAVLEFQLTSNVRLNNLSSLRRHPLKQYLKEGIPCVQGTDGGALYGTDSIDEQLALERLLEVSPEEMGAMRAAEERVRQEGERVFAEKTEAWRRLAGSSDPEHFYLRRIETETTDVDRPLGGPKRLESAECLKDRIRELPEGKIPVVVLGGSFNSDRHVTRVQEGLRETLRRITAEADPEEVFFVIGHRMTAYERELAEMCAGRFEVYAFVPTAVTASEARRLRESGVFIRISIEPVGMGVYKSIAYEIFKRRPSVVLALDGNSAGANTVQEARNGRKKARIFINRRAHALAAKAGTLQGYVRPLEGAEDAEAVLRAIREVREAAPRPGS